MQLSDAELLAKKLMFEFGLFQSGWSVEFDNAVTRFGCCHTHLKRISLSRNLVSRNEQPQVEDTIRHEIAHALCPPHYVPVYRIFGRRHGRHDIHGAKWKAMCKVTGANPKRCYDDENVDTVRGDWQATCAGCGTVHTKFRRPNRDLWCCEKSCRRKHGRLQPIQKLVWRHKNAIPISDDSHKTAVQQMKAQLKRQEEMAFMQERIAELEQRLGEK